MSIEVSVTLEGEESPRILQFRKIGIEEGAKLSAKMKSHVLLRESVSKQQEQMAEGVIKEEDEEKFLAMGERLAKLDLRLIEVLKELSQFVTSPDQGEVRQMIAKDSSGMIKAFNDYLEKSFPSGDDEKK